ncbi:N-acetyltransferase [Maricaulaceae bacterium EIL42A08]|nr:N-acetyltransferase [Maricaulaceae bacterium EIL42A08]
MSEASIRLLKADDGPTVLAIYPLAFPDEDLSKLVAKLLTDENVLSLVATTREHAIAHAAFTRCGSTNGSARLALLGPIAVHPDHQRDGLGKGLIEDGARRLSDQGVNELLVLGDPDYYRHRGFDAPASVSTPYPLKPEWAEAWRSRLLNFNERATGTLTVPKPWQAPELWG